MIEKVNPAHPDKIADRIAGAIVDLAYTKEDNPKCAVEVLIGHGECNVIIESSCDFVWSEIAFIVHRIGGAVKLNLNANKQDVILSGNQDGQVRCGDNGIFKGMPLTDEQMNLSDFARKMYQVYPYDGKFVHSDGKLIVCQSNAEEDSLREEFGLYNNVVVNPLGYWTGGVDVDAGATNRKLGSDMADSVTGGGLHGKDLSKADVSVNIYAFLKAQETGYPVELFCAIGDETIDGKPYNEIVEIAREYIKNIGGFEKFAEWGLY